MCVSKLNAAGYPCCMQLSQAINAPDNGHFFLPLQVWIHHTKVQLQAECRESQGRNQRRPNDGVAELGGLLGLELADSDCVHDEGDNGGDDSSDKDDDSSIGRSPITVPD